ncbi:DUF7289 family protein [Natrialba taiwanensis]|uniref:Uncharacterized protein n=1 Tax=Natrialba taiwanensis DSM 12281 TaxID=1230458 RepID=L9ZFN0_9EURY|nr:hypothetical protein [Natrialba taiwanensis]ELY85144.1 hypothetical protein C484_21322 [Natrialba taiwanensis DSM 12281]
MSRHDPNPPRSFHTDERAISEVVAFILVFGIILSSVALLSVTGFQAMEDYQENEQLRNAERAMDALAENFNDVLQYSGIEERDSELSLREGTVTTGSGGTELNISVDGTPIKNRYDSEFYDPDTETVTLGEFRYEAGSETIAYDGGAVVREGETGSAVVRQPQVMCSPERDRAVISLVALNATERSIQSSDGLQFTLTPTDRTVETIDDSSTVSITVEESSADRAWEEGVLDRNGWNSGTCDNVDEVLVMVVEATIEY